VGGKGWRGWRGGWAGRPSMSLDTADQAGTVGQTDGHRCPDHTTNQADVQCNRIGPQATLLMPLKGLTGSVFVLCDLTGLTKGHL